MASLVLLATLSVPLPSAHPEFDRFIETDKSPLEKAQKLSILLGLQQPPTRQSLLKDIVSRRAASFQYEQYFFSFFLMNISAKFFFSFFFFNKSIFI